MYLSKIEAKVDILFQWHIIDIY